MLSPRSRGKGSRRVPWRDGGRGKQKAAEWRKQATHAVDELTALSGEVVSLTYSPPFGRSAADAIYLFDQEIAHTGIRYHAELQGSRLSPLFTIRVLSDEAARATALIARLQKR